MRGAGAAGPVEGGGARQSRCTADRACRLQLSISSRQREWKRIQLSNISETAEACATACDVFEALAAPALRLVRNGAFLGRAQLPFPASSFCPPDIHSYYQLGVVVSGAPKMPRKIKTKDTRLRRQAGGSAADRSAV